MLTPSLEVLHISQKSKKHKEKNQCKYSYCKIINNKCHSVYINYMLLWLKIKGTTPIYSIAREKNSWQHVFWRAQLELSPPGNKSKFDCPNPTQISGKRGLFPGFLLSTSAILIFKNSIASCKQQQEQTEGYRVPILLNSCGLLLPETPKH